MKFLLIVILFCLFICIAVIIYKIFQIRYHLFKDLSYIISQIKNDVTYNKNTIDTILTRVSGELNDTTIKVLKYNSKSNFWSYCLSSKERVTIRQMFDSFGKGDIGYELSNLDYYKRVIDNYESRAKYNFEKNAMMYFKLIIGFGLIFCIILV